MDDLAKAALEFVSPPKEKTIVEQCEEYIRENPSAVAKGAVVGVVAWYTVPVIVAGVTLLPYIGAGYYIYTTYSGPTQLAQQTYSWCRWGRDLVGV